MRRLILLRHAKSAWPDGIDDHDRPLAERGRLASPLMGKYMAEHGLIPDFALVSTSKRTLETWQLVHAAIGREIAWKNEPHLYHTSAHTLLEAIQRTAGGIKELLVVGHNPGLHELALKLIGEAKPPELARLRRKYPTAGLVVIDFNKKSWTGTLTGQGRLEQFETPKTVSL